MITIKMATVARVVLAIGAKPAIARARPLFESDRLAPTGLVWLHDPALAWAAGIVTIGHECR